MIRYLFKAVSIQHLNNLQTYSYKVSNCITPTVLDLLDFININIAIYVRRVQA